MKHLLTKEEFDECGLLFFLCFEIIQEEHVTR